MITSSTLFILGAGANVPYGFPDAKNLRNTICDNYAYQCMEILPNNKGYNQYDNKFEKEARKAFATNFVTAFQKSNLISIDLFLSLNPEYSDSGKAAIVLNILKAEREHLENKVLYNKDDWFQYLFNRTMEGIYNRDKLLLYKENKIGFLTFNYDRLLEQYYVESLLNSF